MPGLKQRAPTPGGSFPCGSDVPFLPDFDKIARGKWGVIKMVYALSGLAVLAILCIVAMGIDAAARRELARRIDEDLARQNRPRWEDDDWP